MDIKTMPTEELQKDLKSIYSDLALCKSARDLGVSFYNGYSVEWNITTNERVIEIILAELARRGEQAGEA